MKRITLVLAVICSLPLVATAQVAGLVPRADAELYQTHPVASASYDRDCLGNGKPRNLASTITVTASGVGFVYTNTETDGVNTWVTTFDTSVANTLKKSCSSGTGGQ
jgi:hypothetical protein